MTHWIMSEDLVKLTLFAEWTTFSRESAICHLFLRGIKCEEKRKICFKILGENPDGDSKQLISQLQALQTYPNKDGKDKTINNPIICPNCHIWGHAEKDCWGQCEACKGWSHQQIFVVKKNQKPRFKGQTQEKEDN